MAPTIGDMSGCCIEIVYLCRILNLKASSGKTSTTDATCFVFMVDQVVSFRLAAFR